MVRDQDEFGSDDLSLRLLLAQSASSRQGIRYTLTDLPDRVLLTEHVERTLAGGARAGHSVAVAFLNLNQSEQTNASLGDAARIGVAQRDQSADEMLLAAAVAMNDAKHHGLGKCRSALQSRANGRSR